MCERQRQKGIMRWEGIDNFNSCGRQMQLLSRSLINCGTFSERRADLVRHFDGRRNEHQQQQQIERASATNLDAGKSRAQIPDLNRG